MSTSWSTTPAACWITSAAARPRPTAGGAGARRPTRRLAARGLTALAYAPAEDANAFAVRTEFARRHQLSRLSDLRALAGRLNFGGPPECPTRRYCLQGLQATYRLRFAAFRPQPSRGATATALAAGEIDVGLLETTYGGSGTAGSCCSSTTAASSRGRTSCPSSAPSSCGGTAPG